MTSSGARPSHATHDVIGYNGAGEVLVHTWHVGHSSMDHEVDVWIERVWRGDDVAKVRIIAHDPYSMITLDKEFLLWLRKMTR